MESAKQAFDRQVARQALHEAIADLCADMESLSKHADFVQLSGIKRSLQNLLNLSRENNAEALRNATPYTIAG